MKNKSPYDQGFQAGQEGNNCEAGLMKLGLACAADQETRNNTKAWLKGFADGIASVTQSLLDQSDNGTASAARLLR